MPNPYEYSTPDGPNDVQPSDEPGMNEGSNKSPGGREQAEHGLEERVR